MRNKTLAVGSVALAACLLTGGVMLWRVKEAERVAAARSRLAYSDTGYGGFKAKVAPLSAVTPLPQTDAPGVKVAKPKPPGSAALLVPARLQEARTAYANGDYKAVEAAARSVVATSQPNQPTVQVASARHLMAFAAARQGDLTTARTRFAEARKDAESLPKASPRSFAANDLSPAAPGEPLQATLAEDAAYQHAACTMGLGDNTGAERELVQFMRDFPESPLVHSSMRRIARLHGGDIPKDAEAVWKQAQVIQRVRQEERDRQAAMCAPECLAHLTGLPVESLAREMKTGGDGTTLYALVESAKRHGFPGAKGVRLTEAGLKKQDLPLVALVQPGHFVVVTAVGESGVTVWDAGGGMIPVPDGVRTVAWGAWKQQFGGAAVIGLTTGKGSNHVISKQ